MHDPGVCLESLRKTTKIIGKYSWYLDGNSNWTNLERKSRALSLDQAVVQEVVRVLIAQWYENRETWRHCPDTRLKRLNDTRKRKQWQEATRSEFDPSTFETLANDVTDTLTCPRPVLTSEFSSVQGSCFSWVQFVYLCFPNTSIADYSSINWVMTDFLLVNIKYCLLSLYFITRL